MDAHERRKAATLSKAEQAEDGLESALFAYGIRCQTEVLHDPTGDAVAIAVTLNVEDALWLAERLAGGGQQ